MTSASSGAMPARDRLAHHPVDVAVVGDVLRVAVVGAERDPAGPVLLDEREQGVQVARHRRLADQQPHPGAQALAALLDRERLVVGADPGGGVGLQRRLPSTPGAWPSTCARRRAPSFSSSAGAPAMTPGKFIISASPSTRRRRMQRLEVAGRRAAAAATRTATRARTTSAMKKTSSCSPAERVEQPVHAVDAEDVRDLVRVGDDGGRPEREDEPRELVDQQLHRLEVHVRVDEARDDVAPRRVERLAPS